MSKLCNIFELICLYCCQYFTVVEVKITKNTITTQKVKYIYDRNVKDKEEMTVGSSSHNLKFCL